MVRITVSACGVFIDVMSVATRWTSRPRRRRASASFGNASGARSGSICPRMRTGHSMPSHPTAATSSAVCSASSCWNGFEKPMSGKRTASPPAAAFGPG